MIAEAGGCGWESNTQCGCHITLRFADEYCKFPALVAECEILKLALRLSVKEEWPESMIEDQVQRYQDEAKKLKETK